MLYTFYVPLAFGSEVFVFFVKYGRIEKYRRWSVIFMVKVTACKDERQETKIREDRLECKDRN